MPHTNLHEFLVALSKHKSLREAFAKDSAGVGAEAGLTGSEIALVKSNDEAKIRTYLGQKFSDAALIQVKP